MSGKSALGIFSSRINSISRLKVYLLDADICVEHSCRYLFGDFFFPLRLVWDVLLLVLKHPVDRWQARPLLYVPASTPRS